MPKPYSAVGLIPTVRGVRKRSEIQRNLDHLAHLIAAASWLSSLDLPVRLVMLPEGALQGFTDEVFDLDHVTYAKECAIDVPGAETRFLGDLAKHWNVYVMAQAKTRHEKFPDRFFNVGFAIDPRGRFLLSAGLNSHHMTVYAIRPDGALDPVKRHAMGKQPNWIEFADLR